MDQANYWMWMRRKQILKSFQGTVNSFNDSWEEKAFAEDAAGPLGGCIWPPRSYSCSFCKREFKSAQALGGHMNVHRRDRARLKQSLNPQNEALQYPNHNPNCCNSLGAQLPSEICTLDHNVNPNSSSSIVASTLSTSKVSALTTQGNHSEHTFMSPYSSSVLQEQHKGSPYTYSTPSWSDPVAVKLVDVSDSKPEVEKNLREEGSICLGHNGYVETDLSVGLNSINCCNRPSGSCGYEAINSKRHKTAVSPLQLLLRPCSNDRYSLQQEVIGLKPSFTEDLDLELRLGYPPKVK